MEKYQFKSALLLGISIGLLGAIVSLLPIGATWEEDFGLGLLFKLRGQRPAPQNTEIISINGKTAAQLGLGEEIPEWPRSLHAELINKLNQADVNLIVYDIFFKRPRDAEADNRLARTIRESGNVVLVSYMQQEQLKSGDDIHYIERHISPVGILADAALDLAPFVLPKVPVKVSRFWTFSGEQQFNSLPTTALLHLADPDGTRLKQLITASGGQPPSSADRHGISQFLRNNRELLGPIDLSLQNHYKQQIPRDQFQSFEAVLDLYNNSNYPYLNFYGPPGSIKTHPIQEILAASPESLAHFRGKTLFIGYAGAYQPKQKDGFYTVFSQADGLDISGVEIAATAFSNLLYRETLSPLAPGWIIALLTGFGIGITLLFRLLPGLAGSVTGVVVGAGYFAAAYLLFRQFNLWLPWFIPLLLQIPFALLISLILHYQQMRTSKEQLRHLFGYYLPGDVIDRLARDNRQPTGQIDSAYGVCLASDAQNYTAMAEQMEPEALQVYLNHYFKILFSPVRSHNGIVSDVVGDAMLAIWPSTQAKHNMQQMACEAALEIGEGINHSDLEPKLVTRIGLHSGELVMSHVGAIDHFEYRAVGDMVNTTSRIENLNKLLGTQVAASEDFVKELQGILTRELGTFTVSGKQQPITLYEIAARTEEASDELLRLHEEFAEALIEWQHGSRSSAYEKFQQISAGYPDDGPTLYYIKQFHERRSTQKRTL
ncbi:MAG: adenylate/guanylate cyclase domain-containing protein [Candidatus Thiodiazotropha sp. LLP2]